MLYNKHHQPPPEFSHHFEQKWYPLNSNPPNLPPQPLVAAVLLPVYEFGFSRDLI